MFLFSLPILHVVVTVGVEISIQRSQHYSAFFLYRISCLVVKLAQKIGVINSFHGCYQVGKHKKEIQSVSEHFEQ